LNCSKSWLVLMGGQVGGKEAKQDEAAMFNESKEKKMNVYSGGFLCDCQLQRRRRVINAFDVQRLVYDCRRHSRSPFLDEILEAQNHWWRSLGCLKAQQPDKSGFVKTLHAMRQPAV
jgi:hypothetical protein